MTVSVYRHCCLLYCKFVPFSVPFYHLNVGLRISSQSFRMKSACSFFLHLKMSIVSFCGFSADISFAPALFPLSWSCSVSQAFSATCVVLVWISAFCISCTVLQDISSNCFNSVSMATSFFCTCRVLEDLALTEIDSVWVSEFFSNCFSSVRIALSFFRTSSVLQDWVFTEIGSVWISESFFSRRFVIEVSSV